MWEELEKQPFARGRGETKTTIWTHETWLGLSQMELHKSLLRLYSAGNIL